MEFILTNGDRITGQIKSESVDRFVIESPVLGEIQLEKKFISQPSVIASVAEPPPVVKVWSGQIAVGMDRRRGNWNQSELYSDVDLERELQLGELNLDGELYYGEENRKMNAQKYRGSGRLTRNFGEDERWNHFYQIESDHDRFANIDWRMTPSIGIGYWAIRQNNLSALLEVGAGVTRTNFRDETIDKTEFEMIPKTIIEGKFFGQLLIREEFTIYPALTGEGGYRFNSKTVIQQPLRENLSLRLSFIDDYNSDPGIEVNKNDYMIITSLVYNI